MAMLMSGEAGATLTTLEQAMQMSPKTRGELIIIGSPLKKWLFALVARHNISNVRELKGKRIGITQLGGSTYYYAVHLLAEFGLGIRDVEWVSVGNSRVPALTSGRIDATMISAPAYFSLEDAGYKSVANILEFDNIHIPNVILLKKSTVAQNPELPALLLKAHAEAVKRFYADKAFALTAYLQYDKQGFVGLARVYDIYAQANALDRVPYIMTDAVQYMIDSAPDTRMKAEMTSFDYRSVIDNSIVDKLIQEGFFLKLFGKDGKVEQEGKIAHAFR
jgi:ABC-type nitrate/sulfonate/bicarbonate transport system substrate-binding protein